MNASNDDSDAGSSTSHQTQSHSMQVINAETIEQAWQRILGVIAERSIAFRRAIVYNRRKSIQRMQNKQSLLRLQYLQRLLEIQNSFIAEIPLPRVQSLTISENDPTEFFEKTVCHFDQDQWLQTFRMSKETFNWICEQVDDLLKPNMSSVAQKNLIPIRKRVAIAIYTMASGTDYRIVGQLFGVSRTSVCKFIQRFAHAIVTKTKYVLLKMPSSNQLPYIIENFNKISGLPLVVGCLGCCHIPVNPLNNDINSYLNVNGWPSMLLEALVDDKMLFRKIKLDSRDASLLTDSPPEVLTSTKLTLGNKTLTGFVIGSASYPLRPWLLKKYQSPTNNKALTWNNSVDKILEIKDAAFRRLFGRWKIFVKKTDLDPKTITIIIEACCILHNLIEQNNDGYHEDWYEDIQHTKYKPVIETENSSKTHSNEGNKVIRLITNYLNCK